VKSEPVRISSQQQQQQPQQQQQYNDLESLELEITPFELTNLKHEPGVCTLTSLSSLLSKATNLDGQKQYFTIFEVHPGSRPKLYLFLFFLFYFFTPQIQTHNFFVLLLNLNVLVLPYLVHR
jgi:hypothetical protein